MGPRVQGVAVSWGNPARQGDVWLKMYILDPGLDCGFSEPSKTTCRSSQGRFFCKKKHLFGFVAFQAIQCNLSFLVPHRDIFSTKKCTCSIVGPNVCQQKNEIEGVGPIWRDLQQHSASNPASDVQNGGMATHLLNFLCGLGSVGVPGLASTPWS